MKQRRASSRLSLSTFTENLVSDRRRSSVTRKLIALRRTSLTPTNPLDAVTSERVDRKVIEDIFRDLDAHSRDAELRKDDLLEFNARCDARLTPSEILGFLRFVGAAVDPATSDDATSVEVPESQKLLVHTESLINVRGQDISDAYSLNQSGLVAMAEYFAELFDSTADCLLPNPKFQLSHSNDTSSRRPKARRASKSTISRKDEVAKAIFLRMDAGSHGVVDTIDLRTWCRMLPLGRSEHMLIRTIMRAASGVSADGLLRAATQDDICRLLRRSDSSCESDPPCVRRDLEMLRLELEMQAKLLDRITGRHRFRRQQQQQEGQKSRHGEKKKQLQYRFDTNTHGSAESSPAPESGSGGGWVVLDWGASLAEKRRHHDAECAFRTLAKILLARQRRAFAEENEQEDKDWHQMQMPSSERRGSRHFDSYRSPSENEDNSESGQISEELRKTQRARAAESRRRSVL